MAHPLFANPVLALLPERTKAGLRRALATELAKAGKHRPAAALRAIALELDAGGRPADAQCLDAADQALRLGDPVSAERFARTAGPSLRRTTLLVRALLLAGRPADADALLAADGDGPATTVLRALVRYEMDAGDSALRLLDTLPRDHPEAAAVRVLVLLGTGRYADVIAEYDTQVRPHLRALASGDSLGAVAASLATAAGCTALVESGAVPEALVTTREALELLPGAMPERLAPLIIEVDCLTHDGRLVEAQRAAEALRDWGLATHGPQATGAGLAYLGIVSAAHGSHRQAAAHMREAIGLAHERDFLHVRRRRLALLAGYEAVCGNFDAARAAIGEAGRAGKSDEEFAAALLRNAQALLLACSGALQDAADLLRRSADHAAALGAPGRAITALHLLARLGHARDAARRLTHVDTARSPVWHAQAAHVRALADRDPAALLDVAAEWQRMCMWHLAAEVNDVAAAGLTGRRAGAATVQRDRLLARCDTGPMPWWPSTHRSPLTPREREVGGLAAQRLGNQEIADLLHLSVRTVENHLQRVYTKLGITGRSALERDPAGLLGSHFAPPG